MKQKGFTLVELLVTVGIIAILATIGANVYNTQTCKNRRSEAIISLTKLAQMQERQYTETGGYASNLGTFAAFGTADTIGFEPSSGLTRRGYYLLSLNISGCTAPTGAITCYEVIATAQNEQAACDDDCQTFSLSSTGLRNSTPTTNCWPR